MQIRRVDIENFRGIKHLSWRIPKGRKFVVLIGPGDSTKSTVLTAIEMALSQRWNLTIHDTDFYMADVSQPISIRVTLDDLPQELRRHDVLGMSLCGIDEAGELYEDPEDEHDACVTIALTVDSSLEPRWTAHRPGKIGDEVRVTTTARALVGAYKVDERVDAHLRWTKTSALGRLTDARHGTAQLLATASRAARDSVAQSIPDELAQLTAAVQEKLHAMGSGEFTDLKAGLDQSLSSSTGTLALYEGPIPLTNYGLGSRRLAAIATQHLAHEGKAVLLIDEVEQGLEPHRLIGLLRELRRPGAYSHVVATTHSPTVLRQLDASDLAIVRRSNNGDVAIASVSADDEDMQKLFRTSPEAFLARRVVVCEGKTEFGIALELMQEWDAARAAAGSPSSAALGVVAVEAGGGTAAIKCSSLLFDAGYDVVLFMDSDVPDDNIQADALLERGISVVRWQDGFNSERAACEVLDADGLTKLIRAAVTLADHPDSAEATYLDNLRKHNGGRKVPGLDVSEWQEAGISIAEARQVVAETASKFKWFKRVDKGRELARQILRGVSLYGSDVGTKLDMLNGAIYRSHMSSASNINEQEIAQAKATKP